MMNQKLVQVMTSVVFIGGSLSEPYSSEYYSDFDIVIVCEACMMYMRIQNTCYVQVLNTKETMDEQQ